MEVLPAAEGQQIIVVGQRKSGGGGGCAQCDQKGGISMTRGATVNENYVDMNNNYVGGRRCSNVYRLEYAG